MNDEEMKVTEKPQVPLSQRVYATLVHWITIVSCLLSLFAPTVVLLKGKDNLIDPKILFQAIFNGSSPDQIWSQAQGGVFPGAHYYLSNFHWGDSLAMFAITLGCSVSLWAIIPAIVIQIKEKNYLDAVMGLVFALLIFFSMIGVLSLQTG